MSANLKAGKFNTLNVTASELHHLKLDWQGNLRTTNKSLTVITKEGIRFDADAFSRFRTSVGDITFDAELGSIKIEGGENVLDAVNIKATHASGGVLIESGTSGVKTSSTGDISLISLGADINIGLPDDDFDTINVNNLTRNIQLEATATISTNSDDFQILASDSISIISLSSDIVLGDSITNPAIRISGGDISIGSATSSSDGKFVIGVSESSANKTGYDGMVLKSTSDDITPEFTIKNSTNTGRAIFGVEAPDTTTSIHQKYVAYKSGTNVVRLDGPEFNENDINRNIYWTVENTTETIESLSTFISDASLISNSDLILTHTLTTGGTYTGTTTKYYVIEIDAVHTTPNKFKWSNDGGNTFYREYVDTDTSAIDLEDGITVTFAETTDYSLGDYYSFTATRTAVVASSDTYASQNIYTLDPNISYLGSETKTDLKLETSKNERIRITADGNIGINYTEPLSTIHIHNKFKDRSIVNTTNIGIQQHPSCAKLVNGGYVIVWESQSSDGTHYDIYGQIYYSDGNKDGNEFRINITTLNNQSFPHVIGNMNTSYGGFMVVWGSEDESDNGEYDIKGQIYDESREDGSRRLKSFDIEVNQTTTYNQKYPRVASLASGDYVVVWESDDNNNGNSNIYAQKITRLGNLSGDEILINSSGTYSQNYPYITGLSGNDETVAGGFVVTFMSQYDDIGAFDIKYRIFDSDMVAHNGSDVNVTSNTPKSYGRATTLGLTDGGFLISYFKSYYADATNFETSEQITSGTTTAVIAGINLSYPNKLHVTSISPGGLFHVGSEILGSTSGHVEQIQSVSDTSDIFTLDTGDKEITLSNNIINLTLHKYITSSTTPEFTINSVNTTRLVDYNTQLMLPPIDFTRDYTEFDYRKPIASMTNLYDKNVVITWNNGQKPSVYYQKINVSTGTLIESEKTINSTLKGILPRNPNVCDVVTQDGLDMGYVITWQSDTMDIDNQGVFMMRFNDNNFLFRANNGQTEWVVNNDGNMGLGTTSPETQIHVKGESPYITLQNSTTTLGSYLGQSRMIMRDAYSVQLAEIKTCYSDSYDTPYPESDNLQLWYKFEETSGMTVTDYSNNINTGVLHNFDLETCRVSGIVKNGLKFNGINSYIDTGDDQTITSIHTNGNFSFSMWVKFPEDVPSGSYDIISNGNLTTNGSYLLYIDSSSVLVAEVYTASLHTLTGSTAINNNEWHHIALVVDSDNTSITIYLDGESEVTTALSGSFDGTNTENPYIGSRDGSNNFFVGVMDDFRMYDVALSDTHITEMYNNITQTKGSIIFKTNNGNNTFSDTINSVIIDDGANFRSMHVRGSPVNNISGSLVVSGSSTVVGTNTSFLSEVMVGDQLRIDDIISTVTKVISNTSLTIDSSITKSDSSPQRLPSIMCAKDTNNAIKFFVDKDGKCGIGEPNPVGQLHISGTTPYIYLESSISETADGGRDSQIIFRGLNSSSKHTMAKIESSHDGSSADTKGKLTFYTNTGSSLNSLMTLDSLGHLYIGNNYPLNGSDAMIEARSPLDTNCDVLINNQVESSTGIQTRTSNIYFQNKEASTGISSFEESAYAKIMGSSDTVNTNVIGRLDFFTNNESTLVSYLTIKNNGKVGIGGIDEPVHNVHMSVGYNNTGTASQSGTTVTGSEVNFTNVVVGSVFIFDNNKSGVITAVTSSSTLTLNISQSVSSQSFKIYYPGTCMASNSKMMVNTTTAHPAYFHVEGATSSKVSLIAEDTTIDYTYSVMLVDTSGGNLTITLPAAANSTGVKYTIKKITATNTMTIDAHNAETIDGSTTLATSTQWVSYTIVCDGSEWFIINSYSP
jgi:hypothetical protein